MPEYLSPGIYMEEVDRGPKPIAGVSTAVAAFVGFTEAGPVNSPQLITSWTQYVETFGGIDDGGSRTPFMDGAYLGYAVYGFFSNGGSRCYVSRIALPTRAPAKAPTLLLTSQKSAAVELLAVQAKEQVSDDISIQIIDEPDSGKGEFTIHLSSGETREEFTGLTLPKAAELITKQSALVTVEDISKGTPSASRLPRPGSYLLRSKQEPQLSLVKASDLSGSVAERSGIGGLEVAPDVTMVCFPDLMATFREGSLDLDGVKAVQLEMIAHCERMGDRVAILDPPPGLNPQAVHAWRQDQAGYDSRYAALYYPWIVVSGADGRPLPIPPSGHIAGIYARNDAQRGVHKAPANEVVQVALRPAFQITKGEQDLLNPAGINCIRSFSGRGIRVWGARTLTSDPAWRYISTRRLFCYVERSILEGTQWVVFEPNTMDLWARVRRDVGAFLTTMWRDGMLFGASAAQAFYVKCDEELNPPAVRDNGQLIIEIGIAPVKPAEFVIFRISQWADGGA